MASLYGMQLVFHGGKCCGIKTVYCMGNDPAETAGSPEVGSAQQPGSDLR